MSYFPQSEEFSLRYVEIAQEVRFGDAFDPQIRRCLVRLLGECPLRETIKGEKMQKRKLGNSNLEASAIGLGCMGMSFAYGTTEERDGLESIATIHRAIELGVTF